MLSESSRRRTNNQTSSPIESHIKHHPTADIGMISTPMTTKMMMSTRQQRRISELPAAPISDQHVQDANLSSYSSKQSPSTTTTTLHPNCSITSSSNTSTITSHHEKWAVSSSPPPSRNSPVSERLRRLDRTKQTRAFPATKRDQFEKLIVKTKFNNKYHEIINPKMLLIPIYIIIIFIVNLNINTSHASHLPEPHQQRSSTRSITQAPATTPTTISATLPTIPTTLSNHDNDIQQQQQQQHTTTMYTIQQMSSRFPADLSQLVELSSKVADDGDPEFTLKCPLETIIKLKPEHSTKKNRNKWFDLIKRKVSATWYKNEQPLWRDNGNKVMRLNNYTLVMFQLRESDTGRYSCIVDYMNFPQDLLPFYDLYPGAHYYLQVIGQGLPDVKPAITHPPSDTWAKLGGDVTFTCNRTETLSLPTTKWFRSCPFGENDTCLEGFRATFEKAKLFQDPYILSEYFINGQIGDTLTLFNISDDQTGIYGCAVSNVIGSDIRSASLFLDEVRPQIRMLTENQRANPEHDGSSKVWMMVGMGSLLVIIILLIVFVYLLHLSIRRDKKMKSPLLSPIVGTDTSAKYGSGTGGGGGGISNANGNRGANLRQHLPTIDCPDIYNIGKTADGFISGHLHQDTGHLLSQSICNNILNDKRSPSISSSNSHHSDEASCSWAKSMSSNGDNCRAFYSHTSNTTATTVPMYDHPPSTGTLLRPCRAIVQDTCVINPTYGFLRPENDATDWAFPRRNLDRLDKIGEGQFGEVWRYVARQKDGQGDIVAVKQLKNRAGLGDRDRLELIAEIEIMKSVNDHPNVIKLLHYCVDEYEPILLIMEYAENGKLQTYLRNCRASTKKPYGLCDNETYPNVTSKELIKFTYHIAKGMEYIASKGIVHRDLASRNILVSSDRICKVADFGFARRINDDCAYERTTTNPVPVKWMAPEALVENKFTSKSDVFSLGILMWEIVTLGATPYEQLTSEGVYNKVTTGGRLERPSHCRDEFYGLMAQCWQHDPTQRPSFEEVACQLEQLLLSENNYIELDQYPEHAYYNIDNKTISL